jgi:hypothetical protein
MSSGSARNALEISAPAKKNVPKREFSVNFASDTKKCQKSWFLLNLLHHLLWCKKQAEFMVN